MHQFDPKKGHMMLALLFDLKFKDVFILNNYVGIEKGTIATTRHHFQILIPLLCSTYQKVHPFVEHPSNFDLQ
jgi:hypothetical protein